MSNEDAMALSDDELNVRLAKLIGLPVVEVPFVPNKVDRTAFFTNEAALMLYKVYPRGATVKGVPKYSRDLNATNEAERTLDEGQHYAFRHCLRLITSGAEGVNPHSDASRRAYVSSGPRHRAEALLLALAP